MGIIIRGRSNRSGREEQVWKETRKMRLKGQVKERQVKERDVEGNNLR